VDFDVVVLGAGAAGMMCAATAGARGRRVALVEHSERLAEKIRISGGGRCNFTHLDSGPHAFLSRNPDFCRSALARYGPRDFLALVEKHGVAWREKAPGQLFCAGSSQQIIDLLVAECDAAGVRWLRPCRVHGALSAATGAAHRFEVRTDRGHLRARSLVVATGGLSVPRTGASGLGYELAARFGLGVVTPRPALVPLALDAPALERFAALSGASFEALVRCAGGAFRDRVLLTHRGLSGPAILQISSYWQAQRQDGRCEPVELDLLPGEDARAWLEARRGSGRDLAALLAERLPRRFAAAWAAAHAAERPLAELSNAALAALADALGRWRIEPSGTLGFAKAEVTLGGVDTRELSSQALEARRVPGLHFVGEVVDVTGWLGGHNFQWAWASGVAAGRAV
jgi:predicted Rossmann fold flavoprotein